MNFNNVYVTGDTHGNFEWLPQWCEKLNTTLDDALIILGDSGILYYGNDNWQEKKIKGIIKNCPITLLCVRGNHENRASNYDMEFIPLDNDPVIPSGYYVEKDYPNIRHIADGSIFKLNDSNCLAIGGAYSIDKEYRKLMGWNWFEDEELSDEEMADILDKIDHKAFEFVFTHTCPEDWQPYDLFMNSFDQSKISKRMEKFMTTVSETVDFDYWFFGHYHDNREITYTRSHCGQGKVQMLFGDVKKII